MLVKYIINLNFSEEVSISFDHDGKRGVENIKPVVTERVGVSLL